MVREVDDGLVKSAITRKINRGLSPELRVTKPLAPAKERERVERKPDAVRDVTDDVLHTERKCFGSDPVIRQRNGMREREPDHALNPYNSTFKPDMGIEAWRNVQRLIHKCNVLEQERAGTRKRGCIPRAERLGIKPEPIPRASDDAVERKPRTVFTRSNAQPRGERPRGYVAANRYTNPRPKSLD